VSDVVVGIGNPFRGDDGVGPAVVALLAGRVPPVVRLVCSDGEPTGLLELWRDAGRAVVIDAAAGGGPPGSVRTVRLRPGDSAALGPGGGTSSHGLGLADALALAAALGTAPAEVVVHAVVAASCAHGAGLSPAVRRAAAEVVELVLGERADGGSAG
jgi:hydrogenase maturation protease